MKRFIRFPILISAFLILVLGTWGGLGRLGITPAPPDRWMLFHGPMMIVGFLGTLISLERAVALGWTLGFIAPALHALGLIFLLGTGLPEKVGFGVATAGTVGLGLILLYFFLHQRNLENLLLLLSSILLFLGNLKLALSYPVYSSVPLWISFFVLTIWGERLELSKLITKPKWAEHSAIILAALICMGAVFSTILLGLTLIAISIWLLRFDIALKTWKAKGLPRFTATCMIGGYLWIMASGLLMLQFGEIRFGPKYDAVLHSFFLGFVFAMIFGHAPIILPAVTGIRFNFSSLFYFHWSLLNAATLLRITGDLGDWPLLRFWGSLGGASSIALFLITTVWRVFVTNVLENPSSQGGRKIFRKN